MAARLAVTHADNRGDDVTPFGYVYFNDDTRVGYAPGQEHPLFETNWGQVTPKHIHLARLFLIARGIPDEQLMPAVVKVTESEEPVPTPPGQVNPTLPKREPREPEGSYAARVLEENTLLDRTGQVPGRPYTGPTDPRKRDEQ